MTWVIRHFWHPWAIVDCNWYTLKTKVAGACDTLLYRDT